MNINTLCFADDTIHYKQIVDKVLKTSLQDNFDQDEKQRGRSQWLPDHSKVNTKSDGDIPSIPGHLLDLMSKGNRLQATVLVLKWNNIWNEKKRHICSDELQFNDNRDSNHSKKNKGNSKDGNRGGDNNNNDKKGNKNQRKRRLSIIFKEPVSGTTRQMVKTQKTTAGIPHITAVVSIKNPDETKDTVFTDLSSGDDTDTEEFVGNKDDKQFKARKYISTARKQQRT